MAKMAKLIYVILGLSGDVKRSTQIGPTIANWGPLFRVSLDLKMNSLVRVGGWGWSNVLVFKGNGASKNSGRNGDRIPGIWMHQSLRYGLLFTNSVNGNANFYFNNYSVKLNKWYNIVIEQKEVKGKVRKR